MKTFVPGFLYLTLLFLQLTFVFGTDENRNDIVTLKGRKEEADESKCRYIPRI